MSKTIKKQLHKKLYEDIKALLHEARTAVARNINTAMVMTYFEIGRMIVEHEQEGAKRAGYAKETLKSLSQKLTAEFDRGFSVDNLQRMRVFYLMYKKYATVSRISAKSPATFPKENEQIFARKYQLYLPSKEELKRQLEE